jgi:hypothetical protein
MKLFPWDRKCCSRIVRSDFRRKETKRRARRKGWRSRIGKLSPLKRLIVVLKGNKQTSHKRTRQRI